MRYLLFAVSLFVGTICLANAQSYMLDGVKSNVVIDVRTPEEFASGHVDGAINIPYDTISAKLPALSKIDKNENILLYCRSGRRSAIAKQSLAELGYRKVQDGGGISSLAPRLKACKAETC